MTNYPEGYSIINRLYMPTQREQLDPFKYSDGEEFEQQIGEIIAKANDCSLFSSELRRAIWDWRSACHLSPVRANILRPLEIICRKRVLELGSGCGVISRYLGELGGEVVALEASPLRAAITRERTRDLANVEVVCERIERFNAARKFDVVTMIGVLQYARLFSNCGETAEIDIIENAAKQLNEHGVLVIAIQNKLSLKSLSGYPEANVGAPYFGIEGRYESETIVRFGLDELKALLASAGLAHQAVLFPFPDYHMPITVLNERATKPNASFNAAPLLAASVGRDRARSDWERPQFSLESAWKSVHASGATSHLSNAFLIIAGKTKESLSFYDELNEYAWHYSVNRHPAYATQKRFLEADNKIIVVSSPVQPGSKPPNVPIRHYFTREDYINGELWWDRLVKIVNRPGWTVGSVSEWIEPWIIALRKGYAEGEYDLEHSLPGKLFDFTPMNSVYSSDGLLTFIDREWEIHSPLKLSYIILRGLFGSFLNISSCAIPASGTPVLIVDLIGEALELLGIKLQKEHIDQFISQEAAIQRWVVEGREGVDDSLTIDSISSIFLDCRIPIKTLSDTLDSLQDSYQTLLAENNSMKEYIATSRSLKMAKFVRRRMLDLGIGKG